MKVVSSINNPFKLGKLYGLLCALLFIVSIPVDAQYIYKNYSTVDGMPSSTVYGCIQDSTGFLWFATDKGLCRFDGSDFFDFDLAEPEESNITTMSLFIDNEQVLAGTYAGFMSISNSKQVRKLGLKLANVDYDMNRLAYKDGILYYRTYEETINAYDLIHNKNYVIGKQDNKKPFSMAKAQDGNIYFAQTGLYKIQKLNIVKINIPLLNNLDINTLSIDGENNIWVSVKDMIYKLENDQVVDSVKCGFYSGNPLFVNNSYVFGLVIYDHYGQGNSAYQKLSGLLDNSGKYIITSIFKDRDDNLWVNTYGKGTYCVLNTYVSTFFGKNELYDAPIHDIYVNDKEEIYMATSQGVILKNEYSLYKLGNVSQHFYYDITKMGTHLLVATAGMDTLKLQKVYDHVMGKTFYQIPARRLCSMNDSMVVFNAWQNSIHLANVNFETGQLHIKDKVILDTVIGRCTKIFKKNRSQVIVSTVDACYLVDFDKKSSKRMNDVRAKVNDIIRDASGSIYMASEVGLYVIKNNHTYLLKEINGVKLKNLSSLAVDGAGRLWIGSNKGLIVWKGNFLRRISGSPFVKSYEINKLLYEKKDNRLYVATNSGLSIVDITKMDNQVIKRIDIILLKLQSGDSIYDLRKPVHLFPENNDIDIYFSAINICSPQDLYFRYTLNNGRTWTIINTKQISFRGLAYGEHKVEIQASLDGINWGNKKEVYFYVNYPFYTTLKFWICILVLVGIIIFLILKWRIRKIEEKAEKEVEFQQKLEELRYEALSAAVDPHFIFNTLGAIQSFVMNRDPFQASDYIAKFAKLIRITLNHAGQKYIDINEEINRLNIYLELEKLRCGDKLKYRIIIDPTVDRFLSIPNMIIQPLLENAILHGILPLNPEITGELEVIMIQNGHNMIISVKDNGVGINQNGITKHGYTSIGINNLKERLLHVKGSEFMIKNLADTSPGERGTIVEIKLPV